MFLIILQELNYMSNKIIEKIKRLFRKQEEDTSIIFKLKPEEISKPIEIKNSEISGSDILLSSDRARDNRISRMAKTKGGE